MKRIKIAQIGVGHDHAPAAIQTLKLLDKAGIYELVGYCVLPEDSGNVPENYESNKGLYKDVKQMSLEEILNHKGLDAVAIETEDRALTKYALMAAEKGLHIQMDKPGGIDDAEFDRLIDAVESKKLVFHTGYSVPSILVISLVIAIILNRQFVGRTFFRTMYFLPVIIATGVVMELIMRCTSPSLGGAAGVDPNQKNEMINAAEIMSWLNLSGGFVTYFQKAINGIFSLVKRIRTVGIWTGI